MLCKRFEYAIFEMVFFILRVCLFNQSFLNRYVQRPYLSIFGILSLHIEYNQERGWNTVLQGHILHKNNYTQSDKHNMSKERTRENDNLLQQQNAFSIPGRLFYTSIYWTLWSGSLLMFKYLKIDLINSVQMK